VVSLTGGYGGFCAVLTTGNVDCWGNGGEGQLGNGTFYSSTTNNGSATPVQVVGVGGTGLLSGVESLTYGSGSYCAVLTTGNVDCWGYGGEGQLGNGTFYSSTTNNGSATPVQVVGVGGTGLLTGVVSLTSGYGSFCAVLTTGNVDCWGLNSDGELGGGGFTSASSTPAQVVGVGGSGLLSGVTSLTSAYDAFCAVLTTGNVDCWGDGYVGQLGNGTFYNAGTPGSASPVQVVGVGASGLLAGVVSLISDGINGTFCAVLSSSTAACWGYGVYGELGDGTFISNPLGGSSTPVLVVGVGESGLLSGIASVTSAGDTFCAALTSGAAICWGRGTYGELGDGTFYTTGSDGSSTPVQVVGVGGSGLLTGVTRLAGGYKAVCAVVASGEVECWGYGPDGTLGNGTFTTSGNEGSSTPVQVMNS
jgi:alpha-tubulin suppressor-like RCC1 family protein